MPVGQETRALVQMEMLSDNCGREEGVSLLREQISEDAGLRHKMTFHSHMVTPVFRPTVRNLCKKSYPNHPHGCPNWAKRPTCPPECKLLPELVDASHDIHILWAEFPFGEHVKWMQSEHPTWSKRQLECCIYWQHSVRKYMNSASKAFQKLDVIAHPEMEGRTRIWTCPEAMGVDVTATMRTIGVELEWPPKHITRMVYLFGVKR